VATAAEIADALRVVLPADAVLSGIDEVRAYEFDAQTLHGGAADVVALPRSTEDVRRIVRVARSLGVAVVPRGAGTGLSGGAIASEGGVLVSTARMNRILAIEPEERRARVQPGVVNARLNEAAQAHGLRFAPDPSSQSACTIGGNVAENSGGPHTLRLGVTTNHVLALELVTPDGESHRIDADPVLSLVIGSEGLFGIVTEIEVRLVRLPQTVKTFLASYARIEDAGRAVAAVIATGVVPAALELMDRLAVQAVEDHAKAGFPRDAAAVLLVELEGSQEEVEAQSEPVLAALRRENAIDARFAQSAEERGRMWKGRKQVAGALGRISRGCYSHDVVVPPSRLAEALARISEIAQRHGMRVATVCHAGDGNLHPLLLFERKDREEIGRAAAAGRGVLETCIALGGSLSGEHGIGGEKKELLGLQYDEATLALFREVHRAFDERGTMNPGKLFPSGDAAFPRGEKTVRAGWL
jgi:glycolate dehydrogenase FAD-linked subunit